MFDTGKFAEPTGHRAGQERWRELGVPGTLTKGWTVGIVGMGSAGDLWENTIVWVNLITTSLISRTLEIIVRLWGIIPKWPQDSC